MPSLTTQCSEIHYSRCSPAVSVGDVALGTTSKRLIRGEFSSIAWLAPVRVTECRFRGTVEASAKPTNAAWRRGTSLAAAASASVSFLRHWPPFQFGHPTLRLA